MIHLRRRRRRRSCCCCCAQLAIVNVVVAASFCFLLVLLSTSSTCCHAAGLIVDAGLLSDDDGDNHHPLSPTGGGPQQQQEQQQEDAIVVGVQDVVTTTNNDGSTSASSSYYGVDCSYPIHQNETSTCSSDPTSLLHGGGGGSSGKQGTLALYDNFMQGCRQYWQQQQQQQRENKEEGGEKCDVTEKIRLEMNVRQPQSVVNYTATGFHKLRAPKELYDPLLQHWERHKTRMENEQFFVGNSYINSWDAPVYMVDVYDEHKFPGAGPALTRTVWDSARRVMEEWTGQELRPISMWGIRVYTAGSILAPHVDRLPLVTSCIINVAQDVTAPWPLEVYDRNGRAVNVTMEPGDIILYESHSVIHGRPFPLEGKYFANVFIHYEPTGRKLGDTNANFLDDLDDMIPPYLLRNSPQEAEYLAENPDGWKESLKVPTPYEAQEVLSSQKTLHKSNNINQFVQDAHQAARLGDTASLQHIADTNSRAQELFQKDDNGWTPLHEAVRHGHLEAVQFLIERVGANKNGQTGAGDRPLTLAQFYQKDDIVQYLNSLGANQ